MYTVCRDFIRKAVIVHNEFRSIPEFPRTDGSWLPAHVCKRFRLRQCSLTLRRLLHKVKQGKIPFALFFINTAPDRMPQIARHLPAHIVCIEHLQ